MPIQSNVNNGKVKGKIEEDSFNYYVERFIALQEAWLLDDEFKRDEYYNFRNRCLDFLIWLAPKLKLSGTDKDVLTMILRNMNYNPKKKAGEKDNYLRCWMSNANVAELLGVSTRQVRRSTNKLADSNIIVRYIPSEGVNRGLANDYKLDYETVDEFFNYRKEIRKGWNTRSQDIESIPF